MMSTTRLQAALAGALMIVIFGSVMVMALLIHRGVDGNAVAVVSTVVMALVSPLGQAFRHLFPTNDMTASVQKGSEQ